MRVLPSIFSFFCNMLNTFNNTVAQMLDSLYTYRLGYVENKLFVISTKLQHFITQTTSSLGTYGYP